MKQLPERRIPPDVKKRLVELCMAAVASFRSVRGKLHYAKSAAHTLSLALDPAPGAVLKDELVQELRKTQAHKDLVKFVLHEDVLWRKLIRTAPSSPSEVDILEVYVEITMIRAVFGAGLDDEEREHRFEQFVDFLDSPHVARHVQVPLFHLELDRDSYDLGEFGILKNVSSEAREFIPSDILEELESVPRCVLSFAIRTDHFIQAHDFPLSDLLKARIGLLRLAVHPLIAYNRFAVEHVTPWEFRIRDEAFLGRHWSRPASVDIGVRPHLFTDADAESVKSLQKPFEGMRWEQVSPWRLAMDRLDDAVFKLECASPDAILDLVIGLESVFIEEDSRQESTHKVALRICRFLEERLPSRRELFRTTKQVYRTRSTLAHGQRWVLDADGVSRVEAAAHILARTLRKMVEIHCSDLDHVSLDLA